MFSYFSHQWDGLCKNYHFLILFSCRKYCMFTCRMQYLSTKLETFFKYMYIDKVEITGNPFNGQWIKPISYYFKKAYNIFYDFYRKQNFLYSCHIAKTIIKWEVWIFCFWQINTAWSYWTQSILKWCSNFKAKKITIV